MTGGSLESGDKGKPFVQNAVAVGDEGAAEESSAPPRPAAATGEGSAPVDDGGLVRWRDVKFWLFLFALFAHCHVLRKGAIIFMPRWFYFCRETCANYRIAFEYTRMTVRGWGHHV